MIPLLTFLFELILNFFFGEALWFFLFISSGHDHPDPTPTPPPTPHTIMWQVSLYADRSHSCTLTRQRFKYRNSSECLSPNWSLFANAVTISHLCWYCLTLEKGSADVSEILRFIHQSGISLNLRTGPTGHATLFNQWEGALVFINKQIKTIPQWSKILKTTDGVGQNQSSFRGSQAYF